MIERSAVNTALAAAERTLAQEPGFAWIKKSSLLERAYFAGLLGGLSGIAREEDIGCILVRAMFETMYPRSADDSFQSTRTGVLFDSLRRELLREHVDHAALVSMAQEFIGHIDVLDRQWDSAMKQARTLVEATAQSIDLPKSDERAQGLAEQRERLHGEIHGLIKALEGVARHIALVETDHETWNRVQK